jgi:hypothetical protein
MVVTAQTGRRVLWPRSINFATLGQKEFGPLRQAVEEILEVEIGVTAEELLNLKGAAV